MGPIITLLTDFGRIDPYAGILHGVIACIAPEARIIDLSHDIPPQDVAAASFCLACAVPCFPDGTIHVAVVDPGVGTARRAVALAVEGGFLVGPDNGLFTGVLARTRILAGVALDDPARWRTPQPSPVFHGRDIFAPAAAHLAHGIPLDGLGTPLDPAGLVRLDLPRCVRQGDRIQGCVQHVDQFGNLVTNIPADIVAGHPWRARVGGRELPGLAAYGEAGPGALLALAGSHGFIELAVNGGSASAQLDLAPGAAVEVQTFRAP